MRRGEIVGVCGLLGSGQNSLARALAGDAHDVEGRVAVDGREATARSPRQAFRAGIALITENRQEDGLFPDMSVRANLSIASLKQVLAASFLRVILARKESRLTALVAARVGISHASCSARGRLRAETSRSR